MKTTIRHINPENMFQSPAFSQAVTVQGAGTTIYIGGQDAVNANGEIVGGSDIGAQTEQAMQNLQTVLETCGATFADLVKLTIYLVHGQDVAAAYQRAQPFFSQGQPPAITVVFVSALGQPGFLVEIDGIAVVGEKQGN